MIKTDLLIIGAGPTGLFAVFEAGLLKLKCHLIDSLPMPGGQCAEIYPKKPIYDIPSHPEILAGELIEKLETQIAPFQPGYTLGESAVSIERTPDDQFIVTTDQGTQHQAPVVAIAGGLGTFEARKPPLTNLDKFEKNGVDYIIKDPERYRGTLSAAAEAQGLRAIQSDYQNDQNYNPYPGKVSINNNQFENRFRFPTLSNDFGKLWFFKNRGRIPDIAYDGILPEGTKLQDPKVILCIQNNENASFVFLDAANDFEGFSSELTPFNCSLN